MWVSNVFTPTATGVNITSSTKELSQDEWDLYKLNSAYLCFVRKPPFLSTVTRIANDTPFNFIPATPEPDLPRAKRRLDESPRLRNSNSGNEEERAPRRFRTAEISSDNDDDSEDEVSEMVIDTDGKKHLHSERLRKVRANKEEARRKRKEWNDQRKRNILRGVQPESPPKPFMANHSVDEDVHMTSMSDVPESPRSSPPVQPRASGSATPTAKRKCMYHNQKHARVF